MQNVLLTQLTIPEIRQLLREEINDAFAQHTPAEQSERKKILNFDEACAYLSISKSHGYKLTSKGLIPHSKRGKRIYFMRSDLDTWLLSNKVKTVAELGEEMENYLTKKAG